MPTLVKILLWLLFWPLLLIPKLWRIRWIGKPLALIWSLVIGLLALAAILSPNPPTTRSTQRLAATATPSTIAANAQPNAKPQTEVPALQADPTATSNPSPTPIPQSEPSAPPTRSTPAQPPSVTPTAPPPIANARAAQVTKIVDGDTISVVLDGVEERVRYIGIDTPEQGQPGYQAATEANRALLEGQKVFLVKDISDRDRNDRLLRQVYLTDGRWINGAMVQQGWAQPVRYPPDIIKAAQVEKLAVEAAQARRGFWSGTSAYDGAMSYGFTTQALNLHTGPATNFEVSNTIAPQTPLTIFGRNEAGDWLQVRLPDRSGGWISAPLITVNVAVTAIPVAKDIPQPPPVAQPTTPAIPKAPATPIPETTHQTAPEPGGGINPQPFVCNGGCSVAPDPSCAIKGNVNSKKQKIYHIPGWRDYDKTNIKPEEGDRWFCTEEEAITAGFRAPQNP